MLEPLFVKYGVDVVFAGHEHVYERVHPQQGIYYFTEGASGSLRAGNLAPSTITAKGFDTDRSFMMIEIAGDDLYLQDDVAHGRGGRLRCDSAHDPARAGRRCAPVTGAGPASSRTARQAAVSF